jgi:shikimate kinase
MRKIIIAGTAGAGKSAIGRILSKELLFPLIDLDNIILRTSKTGKWCARLAVSADLCAEALVKA